jgi:hypothetical protein
MSRTIDSAAISWFSKTVSACVLLLVAPLALSPLCASAEAPPDKADDIETLQELTSRWLDLRKELSTARKEWKERRALLEDRREMLQSRKETLRDRLTARRKEASEGKQELSRARGELERYTSALESLLPPAKQAQRNLEKMRAGLPPLLKQKAGEAESFGGSGAENDRMERALQRVLGLYRNLARLTGRVTVGRAIVTGPEGEQHEADVVYLGGARGFALLPDRTTAAVGSPGQEGWTWQWGAVEPSAVAHAIDCCRNEKPAIFVVLPLKPEGGTQ